MIRCRFNRIENVYFLEKPPKGIGEQLDEKNTTNIYCTDEYADEWNDKRVAQWMRDKIVFMPMNEMKAIIEREINATPDPAPTATPMPTPTIKPTPTSTATPKPTLSPTPALTATPVPEEPTGSGMDPVIIALGLAITLAVAAVVFLAVKGRARKKRRKKNRTRAGRLSGSDLQ